MINQDLIKKILVWLVIIIAIFVGVGFTALIFKKEKPVEQIAQIKQKSDSIEKFEVDTEKTPEKFPANVPIEAGATITQNYNAKSKDGQFQATRAFETKKSLQENLDIYTQYLRNNGWKVQTTTNQPTLKMVMGVNGRQQLQVTMSENKVSLSKTVVITFTELP